MYIDCHVDFLHFVVYLFSEILQEERQRTEDSLRRENRRVQAMSWGNIFVSVKIG